MVNKENILLIADLIENQKLSYNGKPIGFNMADWFRDNSYLEDKDDDLLKDQTGHGCGTNACICGWVNVYNNNKLLGDVYVAGEFLGLAPDQRGQLFWANETYWPLQNISQAQAVAVLRNLAETGEVDWRKFDYLSESASGAEENRE